MINNDNLSSYLNNYLSGNSASKQSAQSASAADIFKQLKAKHESLLGKTAGKTEAQVETDSGSSDSSPAQTKSKSPLQDIFDRMGQDTVSLSDQAKNSSASGSNFGNFLNSLPLDQFGIKNSGLGDLLGGSGGSSMSAYNVRVQYELNYQAAEMVANDAGGYDIKQTSFSFKLDFSYLEASAGSDKTQNPFAPGNASGANSDDLMARLKEYFSPEKTAERIVDFATAFFPNSRQFKEGGDTEEARGKFAEIMRDAVQKGFDKAGSILGKVPAETQEGIDKTHELTFKGIDDFVKNGLNQGKADSGIYASLQSYQMSMSYESKSVTTSYSAPGALPGNTAAQSAAQAGAGVNAEA